MVNIIAMLTHEDRTVPDALSVFQNCRVPQVRFWGFKDTPLPLDTCRGIASAMRAEGKSVVFESLKEDEADCMIAAEFVVQNSCSHLIGCAFHPSVARLLSTHDVAYLPTFGRRSGVPRMLHGTIAEIRADAERVIEGGADGLCLSMYRYTDGDPLALARDILGTFSTVPTVITGSINSFERVQTIRRLSPWGITIGSALFEQKFGAGLNWPEQLRAVSDALSAV